MYIIVSALTLEEAEVMVKIIEKAVRKAEQGRGIHRTASWSRRANDNIRAQIVGTTDGVVWDYIGEEVMQTMTRQLRKSLKYQQLVRGVVELATCEATL